MPQLQRSTSLDTLRHDCKDLGLLVARLLAGAWRDRSSSVREDGTAVEGSESQIQRPISAAELTEITPLLCRSGAGALAWWQIRDTPLRDTDAGRELHEVYRRFRLLALLHEREFAPVFSLLHDEGIEAVLVKGWSIARRYPERGLRPYGDIDLCVAPDQFERAERVLAGLPNIDLHRGFTRIGQTKTVQRPTSNVQRQRIQQEWDELYARTQVVCLSEPSRSPTVREGSLIFVGRNSGTKALPDGRASAWDPTVREGSGRVERPLSKLLSEPEAAAAGSLTTGTSVLSAPAGSRATFDPGPPIRILADEDHLRLLCIHLLRSGARRPPWLCDVALLLDEVQHPSGSPTVRKGSGPVPTVAANLPRPDFNWDVCLGTDPVHANWVLTAITLAHEVLGGEQVQLPMSRVQRQELPRWLVPALLKQWGGSVQLPSGSPTVRKGSLIFVGRNSGTKALPDGRASAWGISPEEEKRALPDGRASAWSNLYQRWDNPIRATAAVGGRFNNWPRLPYRLAESMMRLPEMWRTEGRGQRAGIRVVASGARSELLTSDF
jgi:hypothetical protein